MHPSGLDQTIVDRVRRRMNGETVEGDELIQSKWDSAKSYKELVHLNKSFLRGELDFTPYHCGPTFDETAPLIPALLRLHDYGILTISSQPPANKPDHWICDDCDEVHNAMVKQRPYVKFILPGSDENVPLAALEKFVAGLMAEERVYTSILKFEDPFLDVCGGCAEDEQSAGHLNNFPAEFDTHIAVYPEKSDEENETEPLRQTYSIIDPLCSCELQEFKAVGDMLRSVRPLLVNILALDWELEDLVGLIEEAVVKAGLPKAYAE